MNNKTRQYERDLTEQTAVNNLNVILLSSKRIIPEIKSRDKIANIDGYLCVKEINGDSIGTLEVQVKGKTNITSLSHSFSKKFLMYCVSQNLPVISIIVDNQNNKAFWMHMSKPICKIALEKINSKKINSTTLKFQETHYIETGYTEHCVIEFIKILASDSLKLNNYDSINKQCVELNHTVAEINKYHNMAIGKHSEIYREIHIFLDYYNNLLDHDFKALKENLYPGYWKTGMGFYDYSETTLHYVMYPISFELNDVQIKQFKKNETITQPSGLIKYSGYSRENPIKIRPKQYAYECIKKDIIDKIFGKLTPQLLIKNFFLATEHLFSFIDMHFRALNLKSGLEIYSLNELTTAININFSTNKHVAIFPSTQLINLDLVRELIKYLKYINVDVITRDNYYSLSNLDAMSIIKIRQKFYDTMPKIYDLLVATYFPNLLNDLKFFENYNLLIVAFESSPRNIAISGISLTEHHYYLQSLVPSPNITSVYPTMESCPITPYSLGQIFKINGIQYKLIKQCDQPLTQYERTPLKTVTHDLLKSRLLTYLDANIRPNNSPPTTNIKIMPN